MRQSLSSRLSTSFASAPDSQSCEFALVLLILFVIMKIVVVLLLFSYVSTVKSTLDHLLLQMPLRTPSLPSMAVVSREPPVTEVINTLLDFANDTLLDASGAGSLIEEIQDEAATVTTVAPVVENMCLSSRSVVVLRWLEQRLYKLGNAAIELLSVPLEMIRVAVTAVLGFVGDTAFHMYGYDDLECRHRVMCEVASFFSNYLPQSILSLFERNWDTLVRVGSRLKVIDIENEYMQAAIIGAFEANCTIFSQDNC